MNKFLVVVLQDAARAEAASAELAALHVEGNITLYGAAIVRRRADGGLSILSRAEPGPSSFGVGALASSLIAAFADPVRVAVFGLPAGVVGGGWRDYLRADVSSEFFEELRRALAPNRHGLIADICEEWLLPLDTRMARLGGKVLREPRAGFIEDLLERRIAAGKLELSQRRAERRSAAAQGAQVALAQHIEHTRGTLLRAAEQVRVRLNETRKEMAAKLEALRAQTAHVTPQGRFRIQQRVSDLRREFREREQKLMRAHALTQLALHPNALPVSMTSPSAMPLAR
jgi:uncharacterized membrane protein